MRRKSRSLTYKNYGQLAVGLLLVLYGIFGLSPQADDLAHARIPTTTLAGELTQDIRERSGSRPGDEFTFRLAGYAALFYLPYGSVAGGTRERFGAIQKGQRVRIAFPAVDRPYLQDPDEKIMVMALSPNGVRLLTERSFRENIKGQNSRTRNFIVGFGIVLLLLGVFWREG